MLKLIDANLGFVDQLFYLSVLFVYSLELYDMLTILYKYKQQVSLIKSRPITGLDRPRGFQEVKVPRFRDNGAESW